jgi:hypothetical protein
MKAVLHQKSLTSIAADAIACRLSCWRAGAACPRGAARALVLHARARRARTNFIFFRAVYKRVRFRLVCDGAIPTDSTILKYIRARRFLFLQAHHNILLGPCVPFVMGISLCTIRPFWLNHDSRGARALAVASWKENYKKIFFLKKKRGK